MSANFVKRYCAIGWDWHFETDGYSSPVSSVVKDYIESIEADNAKLKADAERMFQANVEKNNEVLGLLAENAKLRELVALWSVINKHMSLCATTDCEQCPVREECEESVYLEGLLGIDPKGLSWRVQERMRELEVDVDDG